MLSERAAELSERLLRLSEAKAGAQSVGKLTSRSTQIAEDAQLLRNAAASVVALQAVGASPAFDRSYLRHLHQGLAALQQAQRTTSTYLVQAEGETTYREQRRFLKDFAGKLNASCAAAWNEFVQKENASVDSSLLGALAQVGAMAPAVAEIRAKQARLEALSRSVPVTTEAALGFLETSRAVRERWDQIVGSGLPDDVKTFLRALGQGAVPLLLLTEQVRLWISEKGLGENFYVIARSAR